MTERVITPPGQRHFIEPFDQRVFQFDTDKSDVFLSRVANSVYQVLGDDIVMYGLEVKNPVHTADSVQIDLTKGAAIQDQTLIITPDDLQLELTGVSGMDESGRIVVMANYNYLETFEQNRHSFNMNYIDSTGSPLHDFMTQRDRIVLAVLQFTKDASDNVTGVSFAPEKFITINGNQYYVKGYSVQNKRLTAYLIHQLISGANTSIELDPTAGLRLIGDQLTPGNLKFYGTNQGGAKGWFDISTLSVDNESDILGYQEQYNQVLYNGNMYFVKQGHDITYELYPFWQAYQNDLFWSAGNTDTEWDTGTTQWQRTPSATGDLLKLNIKSGTEWAYGYRPIKFRIISINGAQEDAVRVTLFDTANNVICEMSPYLDRTELICDFSNDLDIGSLEVELSPSQVFFEGIRFFGGTPGGIV
jgi:hypothetical protein